MSLESKGSSSAEREAVRRKIAAKFKIAAPPGIARAPKALQRQYLPSAEELKTTKAELSDPIGDDPHQKVAGLIHRYPNRVLLMPIYKCAAYCRFCFRRNKVGKAADLTRGQLLEAISYIKNHKEIKEVILSGGDPLLLSAEKLAVILRRLARIPHVRTLRIHSRLPITAPRALSKMKLRVLAASEIPLYAALHCNHADELQAPALAAVAALRRSVSGVLAQTVLLKGVNDDADVLEQLCRRLVENGILPYYLHHPDLAAGTGHFRVSIARGRELAAELEKRLGGFFRPRYVLDIPGGFGKTVIAAANINRYKDGWRLRDWRGDYHFYRDDLRP